MVYKIFGTRYDLCDKNVSVNIEVLKCLKYMRKKGCRRCTQFAQFEKLNFQAPLYDKRKEYEIWLK